MHVPGRIVALAAGAKRPSPKFDDMVPEGRKCATIGRHRVVREIAGNHLLQPPPLHGKRLVHAPPKLRLDLPVLRPHAVEAGLPLDEEVALPRAAADQGEAEKGEGLRLAFRVRYRVGAPWIETLSRLNGWPVCSPADASPLPSREAAHGSGPMRVATSSSQWTSTTYSSPVSRRTACSFEQIVW